jgi:Xaa-Pro aminopeptidase
MRKVLWLSVFVCLIVLPSHAGRFFTKDEFAQRRQKLFPHVSDGVAILLGAETPEAYVKFRQDNTFYYFTGVEVPDCVALLDGATKRTTLFVPDRPAVSVSAEASVKPGEEGQAKTGIEAVLSRSLLNEHLTRALSQENLKNVYLVLAPEETACVSRDQASVVQRRRMQDAWDGRLSRVRHLARLIGEKYPNLTVKDLTSVVDEMRWVKSPAEIAALRECGRIGALGVRDAIAATKPGLHEYYLEGVATGRYLREGAQGIAFHAIVASGENTLELHYAANNRKMEAGDVVLMDFAPDLNNYVTDITRSWPVSGRFTDDQLKMYNCLLDAHKQTIAAVKPGATFRELVQVCRSVFEKHGFGRNMLGGIGHFVGMSVHDPGFYDRPFVPGVVFNVEPLFIDREKKIHMRLEDTIIVTENGHENVTAGVPMEVEEIYKLMQIAR